MITADYVAICAGLHVTPSVPVIPGIEHVVNAQKTENGGLEPIILHSSEYKSRSILTGRRVMVLGTGETGMDLAYDAAKAGAKQVVLCSRSGCVEH